MSPRLIVLPFRVRSLILCDLFQLNCFLIWSDMWFVHHMRVKILGIYIYAIYIYIYMYRPYQSLYPMVGNQSSWVYKYYIMVYSNSSDKMEWNSSQSQDCQDWVQGEAQGSVDLVRERSPLKKSLKNMNKIHYKTIVTIVNLLAMFASYSSYHQAALAGFWRLCRCSRSSVVTCFMSSSSKIVSNQSLQKNGAVPLPMTDP